ncbi:glycosyltransferase family 4 protein (plasmid) [Leisingera sp. S132]|uniref:glycosyltransferase family 4 protein n=1 Tax=Leisingera sp. S132 TaxID=2867016 RepID=UPI0021A8FC00|nr:glycosyltransferase family 4 protein [Leisingera sp. S132]UWQ81910.1 glycosyltransferase family 4 protein [Leisingera sp. S132]
MSKAVPGRGGLKSVIVAYDFAHINGGQAKVAIESALLLAATGLDVTYFAAAGPADARLEEHGIRVVLLDQKDILSDPSRLKAAARGIWNTRARRELAALAQEFDPASAVLHCHGYAKALSPSIGPELAGGALAAVYTMHEYFLACPNGGFYDFKKHEICTRKALSAGCLRTNCDVRHPAHKAWRAVRQAVTRGPGQLPSGLRDIIYISDLQRKVMAPYLPGGARMHYVPNPVVFPDMPAAPAQDQDIFLFIGRMSPEKGARIFAEAAKLAGVRAVFVGDGPDAEHVRRINPAAEITGWASPAEVEAWIARSRALVFPSLWYETFGLTPAEALGQGRPVITGAWSAAAEFVQDGVNGILCRDASPAALAEAIGKLAAVPGFDPAPLRDFVSPERHVARLLEIYGTALAGHQA